MPPLGATMSETHKRNIGLTNNDANHPRWKGKNATVKAFHKWLTKTYGKPVECEGKDCRKISKRIEWARIHDREHDHKRENYIPLCLSCHKRYDYHGQNRKNY